MLYCCKNRVWKEKDTTLVTQDIGCISNDPNFHLKHTGVLHGSDGSDGTSYALTENYTLPVAYVPHFLCGDV